MAQMSRKNLRIKEKSRILLNVVLSLPKKACLNYSIINYFIVMVEYASLS